MIKAPSISLRILALAAALAIQACSGGGSGENDTSTQDDTLPGDAADTSVDPDALDPDGGDATDTGDAPTDTADGEIDGTSSVCGNLIVEPGEGCEPPGGVTSCTSACATIGSGQCSWTCELPPTEECAAPQEVCNLADDDCDGVADEGTYDAWERTAILEPGDAAAGAPVDLAWTDESFIAAWIEKPGGTDPDLLRIASVDAIGSPVTPATTVALDPGDTAGAPSIAWTGSEMLVAWHSSSTTDDRHLALLDGEGALVDHSTTPASGLGSSADLAWTGSQAALIWTEESAGSAQVHVSLLDGSGSQVLGPIVLSGSAGQVLDPSVDACAEAIVAVWTDDASGEPRVHRAVLDPSGSILASDLEIDTPSSTSLPRAVAQQRIVAWVDHRDSTDGVRAVSLDSSWDPAGVQNEIADSGAFAVTADGLRIVLAAGSSLVALGSGGAAEGSIALPGVLAGMSVALGPLGAAVAGPSSDPVATGLALSLAGCPVHSACDAWIEELEPLESRTGLDDVSMILVHDAALQGSFDARPVTYLSIQIRQGAPWSGPTAPGGFLLGGTGYEDCEVCVLVYDGCSATTCEGLYLASSGTLEIAAIGEAGSTFEAELSDVVLDEADIDFSTLESAWVEGGATMCLGSYDFSALISAY